MDGDQAAGFVFAAADARGVLAAGRDQAAHAAALAFGVDVEDVGRCGVRIVVVVRNRDAAGGCQLSAVEEDEADLAGDRDTVVDLDARAGHDVPAIGP